MDPQATENVHLVEHPLIAHKLTLLRDQETPSKLFAELVNEITLLLLYEACRELPVSEGIVNTPMETCKALRLNKPYPLIIPILRAGLGMLNACRQLMPTATIGHIGLARDENSLQPEQYFLRLPLHASSRPCFVVDPMLATGGSASYCLKSLKQRKIHRLTFVCLLAAPQGIARLTQDHPDVPIYTASIDRGLDDNGFILPGLGDAGDRIFNTEN